MPEFSKLPSSDAPRIVRRKRTALCQDCGHTAWDDEPCTLGHEPEHRVHLSTRELRALEYVRRGMPAGPFDPNYWPGVNASEVAVARRLWATWAPFHEIPKAERNFLFE